MLPLNEWYGRPLEEFDKFISTYQFPDHEEFKKKDKDAVRAAFPRPQILLTRIGYSQNVRVALALYPKEILTGKTLLHLRSINKFEQMEIRYFLKYTNVLINEPKIIKHGFYESCQSSDILFDYKLIDSPIVESARLRILTLKFDEFIMLIYVFDKNQILTQEEINNFITPFRRYN